MFPELTGAAGTALALPEGFDWQHWADRWERMQGRYLVRRAERFETVVRTVRDTVAPVSCIVDLGCGPGSLMLPLLEAFPRAEAWGIDFDPAMLLLAGERLSHLGGRVHLVQADLSTSSWEGDLPPAVDAVVSATALHWLAQDRLATLYRQVARRLRPGGMFLNADHVGSDDPAIQKGREQRRARMRAGVAEAGDWDGFWGAYLRALGAAPREVGGWESGVEAGMPLTWHLDVLRACGFRAVDCFWRCDCDAIYGGVAGSDLVS